MEAETLAQARRVKEAAAHHWPASTMAYYEY